MINVKDIRSLLVTPYISDAFQVNWTNQHRLLLFKKKGHWKIRDRCQAPGQGSEGEAPWSWMCFYKKVHFQDENSMYLPISAVYRQAKKKNEHWHEMDIRKLWYNIKIFSIELKWDGKDLKYDMITRWVNTNNGVKWRWFIAISKVEQINDYLFTDISQIK